MKMAPIAISKPGQEPKLAPPVARTTYRGVARREQILKTATVMFLERGYADVSVDEIVKAVGGSKTNVYSQFGNKEGLFAAAVETLCAEFLHEFKQLDLAHMNAEQGLKRIGKDLLGILLEDRHIAFQRLVIAESGRFPALGRVWFAAGPQQSRKLIAGFIESKLHEGTLRSVDPMIAATLLHDMLVSNPLYLALLGQRPNAKATLRHIDGVVDLFLLGCKY
jgi:TetR/AcrR family transcriptional regulator, mexJK operon transcriptional repressor